MSPEIKKRRGPRDRALGDYQRRSTPLAKRALFTRGVPSLHLNPHKTRTSANRAESEAKPVNDQLYVPDPLNHMIHSVRSKWKSRPVAA